MVNFCWGPILQAKPVVRRAWGESDREEGRESGCLERGGKSSLLGNSGASGHSPERRTRHAQSGRNCRRAAVGKARASCACAVKASRGAPPVSSPNSARRASFGSGEAHTTVTCPRSASAMWCPAVART